VARQLCAGLDQAHRQGVIHGDLKTGNIILARSPEGRMRAVITDFGLARIAAEPHADETGGGTYDYMAPELFHGERASVASDVYALGVLFHVMLTGKVPARKGSKPELPTQWTPDSAQSTQTWSREHDGRR